MMAFAVTTLLTVVVGLVISFFAMNWSLELVNFLARARRIIRASLSRKSRSPMLGRTGMPGSRPKDMTIINRVINRVIPKSRG